MNGDSKSVTPALQWCLQCISHDRRSLPVESVAVLLQFIISAEQGVATELQQSSHEAICGILGAYAQAPLLLLCSADLCRCFTNHLKHVLGSPTQVTWLHACLLLACRPLLSAAWELLPHLAPPPSQPPDARLAGLPAPLLRSLQAHAAAGAALQPLMHVSALLRSFSWSAVQAASRLRAFRPAHSSSTSSTSTSTTTALSAPTSVAAARSAAAQQLSDVCSSLQQTSQLLTAALDVSWDLQQRDLEDWSGAATALAASAGLLGGVLAWRAASAAPAASAALHPHPQLPPSTSSCLQELLHATLATCRRWLAARQGMLPGNTLPPPQPPASPEVGSALPAELVPSSAVLLVDGVVGQCLLRLQQALGVEALAEHLTTEAGAGVCCMVSCLLRSALSLDGVFLHGAARSPQPPVREWQRRQSTSELYRDAADLARMCLAAVSGLLPADRLLVMREMTAWARYLSGQYAHYAMFTTQAWITAVPDARAVRDTLDRMFVIAVTISSAVLSDWPEAGPPPPHPSPARHAAHTPHSAAAPMSTSSSPPVVHLSVDAAAVSTLELFSELQFCRVPLQPYTDLLFKVNALLDAAGQRPAAWIIQLLPGYRTLTHPVQPASCSECPSGPAPPSFRHLSDPVMQAKLLFLLPMAALRVSCVSGALLDTSLAALMPYVNLLLRHPQLPIVKTCHAVVQGLAARLAEQDSSGGEPGSSSAVEVLAPVYVARCLEPPLQEARTDEFGAGLTALLTCLPAGSAMSLHCLQALAQACVSEAEARQTYGAVEPASKEPSATSDCDVLVSLLGILASMLLVVDFSRLSEAAMLLQRTAAALPLGVRTQFLVRLYDVLLRSDDHARKGLLLQWFHESAPVWHLSLKMA